jgi:hypothetical protein
MNKVYLREIVLSVGAFFWFLFVATNVNTILGQTYQGFTALSITLLIIGVTIFDKNIQVTYSKSHKVLNTILMAVGGYIVLLVSSVFVLRFINPASANISSVITLMGATTPALSNSKIINLLTFGLVIPFIETSLWARIMEFICDVFHIQINKQNITKIGLIFIIVLLSIGFAFFHITAKGITNMPSLVIVFIMMLISLLMVVLSDGETKAAVYMHIIANTIAAYLSLFAVGMLQLGSIG